MSAWGASVFGATDIRLLIELSVLLNSRSAQLDVKCFQQPPQEEVKSRLVWSFRSL